MNRLSLRTLPALILVAFSGAASAAAFQLWEQNASGLGTAYAGSAAVADNASKESYGTAFGIFNFVGMSSSIVAPVIAGMIADATGSLATNFYISAAILIVGMVGMMFLKDAGPNSTGKAA